jgi:hypothetical protein
MIGFTHTRSTSLDKNDYRPILDGSYKAYLGQDLISLTAG